MTPELREMFDLTGRTAVVTGCSQGIGRAIAEALAAFGAEVVGGSLDSEDDTKAAIEMRGGKFHAYVADFSNRDSTLKFAAKVAELHGPVDILFNNAGTIYREPAAVHDYDQWDKVIAVNLAGPFALAREFGADMVKRGYGRIVFTASLLSFQGGFTVPGYTASKSGIAGLVKALANEWTASGVNVNGIAPGYIATDNTKALRADAERSQAILDRIPAGRWGTPNDLAGVAVFLASNASAYVSGSIVLVDGGWMGR